MATRAVDGRVEAGYGQFPDVIERDWLGRWCHLSEPDLALIRRRGDPSTRLGFAVQLATVRAIGLFPTDPAQVALPVVEAVARQLGIDDVGLINGYSKRPVRWRHVSEIRERYGYVDFTSPLEHNRLTRQLYRLAWNDDLGPTALVRAAHSHMLTERILLPGEQILQRLIGSIRERAAQRLWERLVRIAGPELVERLDELLVVADGDRRSGLDELRRSPVSPTVRGLVRSLDRLDRVRAVGAGDLDLSRLPARRVAALARYAEDAWVSQLADLAPQRRSATLIAFVHTLTRSAQDDVIDVFDVAFGDMQRSAKSRGQRRRAGELRDYDRAVRQVHESMRAILDALDDESDSLTDTLQAVRSERYRLEEAMETVTALMRAPTDPFHDRLVAAYPQIRQFLPRLIGAVNFDSIETSTPVIDGLAALDTWFTNKPRTTRQAADTVPTGFIDKAWSPYVFDDEGDVNRAAYACCVLDQLRAGLRRRDIYQTNSLRWGDPRTELLPPDIWDQHRHQACQSLGLEPDPKRVIANLAHTLDRQWRHVVNRLGDNPDLRIEHRDGVDRVVITPLDAIDEPASLTQLRSLVEGLMPEVEIADVPLEVHSWTGFFDEYTHISGATPRAKGLHESLAALLVAEACNVGLTPVTVEDHPALTRDRLNWVAQNYMRAETHARASTRLFDYHAQQPLADAWGGGHMASADGMRLTIPVSTIHAGYNPRYFGRQRGSALYTWMADTHSSFHQTLIPGIQRDSLYTLDGLVGNQSTIRPDTISTDTAGASEVVFALTWALGYRYAPRLADIGDHRLWRIDPKANYGELDGLARNRINTDLIANQWDQICRLAASLQAGTVTPSTIMRTLQRGPNPSTLARAIIELGRIIKTLHILTYCDDPTYRRDIGRILNRGETRNGLSRDVFHGQLGKLRQRYQTGQENQLGALGLMINIIVCWNTIYTQAALDHLANQGHHIDPTDVARLSPLGHPTINLQGRYHTTSHPPTNTLRALRTNP